MGKGGDFQFWTRGDADKAPGVSPGYTPCTCLCSFAAIPPKVACLPRFDAHCSVYNKADSRHHYYKSHEGELAMGLKLDRKQSIYKVDRATGNENGLDMLR